MRSNIFAFLIAVLARADDVGFDEAVDARELQSLGGGFGGEDACYCPCDPLRDGRCPESDVARRSPEFCYKPVCEPGYYRCCSTCPMSVCANVFPMVKSRRLLFECIPCLPGDFCFGCDMRRACPQGSVTAEPKMSQPQDCEPCLFTEVVNQERTACCEAGNQECINPPKDFGYVSSLLVPAYLMLM